MKILLIMSRGSFAKRLVSLLGKLEYQVYQAGDLEDAKRYLKLERPDCVIMDFVLPNKGIDGDKMGLTARSHGFYSGWVWYTLVLARKKQFDNKVIFLSDYQVRFDQAFPSADTSKIRRVGIQPSQRKYAGGTRHLVKVVREIEDLVHRQKEKNTLVFE